MDGEKLKLIKSGKVRDLYEVNSYTLLMVATDRMSALDKKLNVKIKGKGEVLNRISNFWFDFFKDIPNHIMIEEKGVETNLCKSASLIRKLKPLPIEAIVRGYIIGSGWKDYQATGSICGHKLPEGLLLADKLPEVLFTPSTKGEKDINITFREMENLVGSNIARQVRKISLDIYKRGSEYALSKGIIIADTKFEFAVDDRGIVTLIDEVLTPDSSRFWNRDTYKPGVSPESFDKQLIRDYLSTTEDTNYIPQSIIDKTKSQYEKALELLLS